ncbi:hypothetical protein AYO21_07537 [Fonsecaea monophora]|uniref:Uncharacterized protein n=1 Tax=Fonsecaea monophora TaxID=254056 RepID=A0A177F1K4_9EURO|nr:hypothetical protein AYO21_07537 [Fonsecaea monophora]OAG38204.1 hypothetical protein AYO21_07537 [Fonsecaea monophora]
MSNARVNRHSRASSIISTQSKFTTTTLQEDARSIDINVGGQYFRISRDGSKITADAPPPYTGPGETLRFQRERTSDVMSLDSRIEASVQDVEEEDLEGDGAVTPRSAFQAIDQDAVVRANLLDPTPIEIPSPVRHDQLTHRSSSATLVISESTSTPVSEFDQSLVNGEDPGTQSGRNPDYSRRRVVSEDLMLDRDDLTPKSSPMRAYRERLPRLITSGEIVWASHRPQLYRQRANSWGGRPLQIRSAGATFGDMSDNGVPRSPDYIDRDARGMFHFPTRAATTQITSTRRDGESSASGPMPLDVSETSDESNTPLPMDNENDISLHYARMMRKLDSSHRKALLIKDKQLAELQEKLNEKDIVLRQQLRAKDFIIDDLKKRLSNLEGNIEVMLEKARHQVEDLWESRWKDRDFHLRERMRRIEEEAQKAIERMKACQNPCERCAKMGEERGVDFYKTQRRQE